MGLINFIGNSILSSSVSGDSTSTDAQAVIDKMTSLVTAEESAISTFVDTNVTNGNWALMIEFISYKMQTEANSTKAWVTTKTHVPQLAPTHTAGVGFVLNGTSQYIKSDFIPSADGILQNNVIVGGWVESVTNNGADVSALFEVIPNNLSLYNLTANYIRFSANGTASASDTGETLENDGLYYVHRDESANHELYVNGVETQSTASASTSPLGFEIQLGRRYNNNDYLNGTLGCFFVAKAIGFDHTGFYNSLVALNTELAAI